MSTIGGAPVGTQTGIGLPIHSFQERETSC
jgi:hypothetical protein